MLGVEFRPHSAALTMGSIRGGKDATYVESFMTTPFWFQFDSHAPSAWFQSER